MNKLFILKYMVGHTDFCFHVRSFWNESEALDVIAAWKGEWTATLVEDNSTHKIWEMR